MLVEMIPGRLWLSSMPRLSMIDTCRAQAVLCCVKKGSPPEVVSGVRRYSSMSIPDGKRFDESLFGHAVRDARGWLDEGLTVLVHCHAGRNRSATVVAFLLMSELGLSPQEAIDFIRARRPRAIANPVFEARILSGDPL